MKSVALEPESDDAELYDVTASSLQENLEVNGTRITGTLKNITDGTIWDETAPWDDDEKTGHFIFLKAVEVPDDAVATVQLYGDSSDPVTLDENRNIIVRVTDTLASKIILKVVKGGVVESKVYTMKGVTLA